MILQQSEQTVLVGLRRYSDSDTWYINWQNCCKIQENQQTDRASFNHWLLRYSAVHIWLAKMRSLSVYLYLAPFPGCSDILVENRGIFMPLIHPQQRSVLGQLR